ncbi:MAG: phosphoribosylformylglycinamidine synthase subunit PurQ [Campylobacterales bacterium]
MTVAIIRFAGTNCDFDMEYAYNKIGVKTQYIWHKDSSLPSGIDLVVLPGGFSYGDYLRSGAIARFSPIMNAVVEFANKGGRVLGICNGFQILLEAGLLKGAMKRNENLHFISKHQELEVVNNNNRFLNPYKQGDKINIPIAHAEGNYYCLEDDLKELEDKNLILLKYINNPNGSLEDIAGICNENKNVFGLMPHPERAMEKPLGSDDGVLMLRSLLG